MRQLSSLDAQFLAVEDGRTHGHVSVLGIYDAQSASGRRLRAELLRELVTERLHLLPPFRWRLATVPFDLDHPYWVDDAEFDVSYHVHELALSAPGDAQQLADQVARLIARPLSSAKDSFKLGSARHQSRARSLFKLSMNPLRQSNREQRAAKALDY